MSKPTFARLPGFRDFVPEDLAFRSHIFDAWRRVSQRYGFEEYDSPPLEALNLYVEKSGPEIVGQLYHFTDKGDRQVTLRPEMTPSLARVLSERSRALPKPIRWFSIPQLFRYERQQKGRLKEHFQWNVDIVGEAGYGADAEVLAVAIDGVRELGLTHDDFRARVSDRRLLSALLSAVGVADAGLPAAFGVIDKLERESADRSLERLQQEAGLDPAGAQTVLELFSDTGLDGVRDRFGDRDEVGEALERLDGYVANLTAMGLGDYITLDLKIVRGLAYYTGIVFELFDTQGEFRAICGGGRYDRLLELVGAEPLPAVGFGMGDVVLGELVKARGLAPELKREIDLFIISVDETQRLLTLQMAHAQRERGVRVLYSFREQGVGKQFKVAGAVGAKEVVVLGPEEVERGIVSVRNMSSGEEREVALDGML